jgi:peptidoglycan/LPS O-acetylase OafA/YrhL
MAGFRGRITRAFFSWTPISTIGGMCYSIYLTHTAVLTALHLVLRRLEHLALSPPVYSFVLTCVSLAAMLAVGTVFFVLIERPCMDPAWPQKLAARFKDTRRTN